MPFARPVTEGDAPPRELHCSFCRKAKQRVATLISGPGGVFICNECVELCHRLLEEEGFLAS